MKAMIHVKRLIALSLLVFACSLCWAQKAEPVVQTGTVVIDFDKTADGKPLDVSLTGQLVANDYLMPFGVTLSDLTPGTKVVILDARKQYAGRAISASSGFNTLGHAGGSKPISFVMNFKTPLQRVEFKRPPLIAGPTGITFPEWTAIALDANGRELEEIGEPRAGYFSNEPAKPFVLRGPGIKAVRFDSSNLGSAFSAVILDDLTLIE